MTERKTDAGFSDRKARGGALHGKGRPKPRVKAEVIVAMARRIFSGDIEPGQYLPTEADLCEEYGVSRTVIRETMKVLESKGLLSIRSRVGTQVLERTSWNMLDPDVIVWAEEFFQEPEYIASLMEIRNIMEPAASALAALRASPENIEELEEALRRMETAQRNLDNEGCAEADADFHNVILLATRNHVLIQLGKVIYAGLLSLFRRTSVLETEPERALMMHREIIDAIRAGDAERARKANVAIVEETTKDLAI